jgi:single-strand DNA-binding protein
VINKVILVGHLGADPAFNQNPGKAAYCRLRIATNERAKAGTHTEWHQVMTFGHVAETCAKYLKKGRLVYIEGKLRFHTFQDRDGNTRGQLEIYADRVQFLGREEAIEDPGLPPADPPPAPPPASDPPPPEDDIPF